MSLEPKNTPDSPPEPPGAMAGVLIRRGTPEDAGFVFSYWLRDAFERCRTYRGMSKALFMRLHHLVLERVVSRSILHVACDPEAPEVVYGFVCAEPNASPPILHYIYTKRRFRRCGIARQLLAAAGCGASFWFTHLTDDGVGLRKKFPLAEYVPYAI